MKRLLRMYIPHFSGHGHYTHRWQRKICLTNAILFLVSCLFAIAEMLRLCLNDYDHIFDCDVWILTSVIITGYMYMCNRSFVNNSLNPK